MQKLAHQPARHQFHRRLLLLRQRTQQMPRAMQLRLPQLLRRPLHFHKRRRNIDRPDPPPESLRLLGNNRLGPLRLPSPIHQVRRSHRLQIVNVVQEHPLQLIHPRVHIARHRNIDHKHRPVLPPTQHLLRLLHSEDLLRRPR